MAYANRRRRNTTTRPASERRDVAQEVTDKFVAAIEDAIASGGVAPWQHPWTSFGRPVSMSTRKPYNGINVWLLALSAQASGYTSPWWGTYRQIEELGGRVRKGEKSTMIVLYKSFSKTELVDGELVDRTIPVMKAFPVFNADQADGLPERFFPQPGEVREMPEPQAVLDGYLDSPGAPEFFQDVQGEAYFIPAANEVHVPPMAGHKTPDLYWATVWHECTHAADFKIRRNAEEAEHGRSKSTYAVGELVAELGASFLAAETGVTADFDNSVSYLRGWLKRIQDDKKLIVKAAAAAQRAVALIMGDDQAEAEAVPEPELVAV
jgi:antirestriction protein ArdC